jgi:hypothetical protein
MSINNKILRTNCFAPKVVGGTLLVPQDFSIVPIGNNRAMLRNGLTSYTAEMDDSGLLSLV